MSMLAEKKRKQRWSLNPRGNAWTEDSNKFGQKMLEKMGWKHGKGLGANEDGIKEHLKVSYKNDSKGMGFKEIEGWTEHEDNFSALLKNLSNTPDVVRTELQVKSTSLEEMSQKSRVRVHYHKFTKGKDLSRYSEKDLASIFGKKSLTPHKDFAAVDVEKSEKFIKKGCMVDYFKKKLPNFSLNTNGYSIGSNGVLQIEAEALEEVERCGFGYEERSQEMKENKAEEIHSKKQSKRKLDETKYNEELKSEKKKRCKNNNGDLIDETNHEGEENGNESLKEKKKNRKAKSEETEDLKSTFVSYLKKDDSAENNEKDSKEEGEINRLEKKKRRKSNNANLEPWKESLAEENKVSESGKNQNIKENKSNQERRNNDFEQSSPNEDFQNSEVTKDTKEIKTEKKKRRKVNNNTDLQNQINQDEQTFKVLEDTKVNESEYDENVKECKKNRKMKLKVTDAVRTTFVSFLDREDNLENDEEAKEPKTSKKVKASKRASEAEAENCQIKLKPQGTEKRSNKQKKNVDDNDQGISNPAFDPRFNNIVVEKHALQTIVEGEETLNVAESETPTNQKPRKKKDLDTIVEAEETFNDGENETPPTNQKSKKKKDRRATTIESLERVECENAGFDNPSFKNCSEENGTGDIRQDNPYEVKPKEKKKKRKIERNDNGIDNPVFSEEIKITSEKRKLNDESNEEKYEVKRKEKKLKKNKQEEDDVLAVDNPGFQEGVESENQNGDGDGELLLNVACLPVPESTTEHSEMSQGFKYRRNVRFNEVVDQRMFHSQNYYDNNSPNGNQQNYYRRNRNDLFDNNRRVMQNGIDNAGYDRRANNMQENIAYMSRTFDRYHAEIENDINESKAGRSYHLQQCYVGEPGHPSEKHVKVMEGTRLSFQNVSFRKVPIWMRNQKGAPGPKKTYRHLIRGDIIVKFNNTNLHEITGYATSACKSGFSQ